MCSSASVSLSYIVRMVKLQHVQSPLAPFHRSTVYTFSPVTLYTTLCLFQLPCHILLEWRSYCTFKPYSLHSTVAYYHHFKSVSSTLSYIIKMAKLLRLKILLLSFQESTIFPLYYQQFIHCFMFVFAASSYFVGMVKILYAETPIPFIP